jgi:hypothetical protein
MDIAQGILFEGFLNKLKDIAGGGEGNPLDAGRGMLQKIINFIIEAVKMIVSFIIKLIKR